MKVFISWSGNTSLKIAQVFRKWIPSVIQSIEPYVSSEDIDKGARWSTDIAKELADSTFGILCVTKDNIEAPWLSFEAGALSKTMDKSFVIPFLFDMKQSEVQGPLLQFQSTIFEKEDIRKMMRTINKASGEFGISDSQLDETFDLWFKSLEDALKRIKKQIETLDTKAPKAKRPEQSVLLEEILTLTRDNQKLLRSPDDTLYSEIHEVKQMTMQLMDYSSRNSRRVQRRNLANYDVIDEILNSYQHDSYVSFLMTISLIRDDVPWIYDMGKELVSVLKDDSFTRYEKQESIEKYDRVIDYTFNNIPVREYVLDRISSRLGNSNIYYILTRYLKEFYALIRD